MILIDTILLNTILAYMLQLPNENCPYFPFFPMKVSHRVNKSVGSQDDARALRPLCAHHGVFSHQDLTNVLRARHSDDGFPQQVCFKHVSILLPPRHMKRRTLS